jgi:hypothetical protein
VALVYRLVGFDRRTEALVASHDIPTEKILQAKTIAGIADNPAIVADWPLSRAQASAITALLGAELDVDSLDWALEPYTLGDAAKTE